MNKQIFNEQVESNVDVNDFQPKREFDEVDVSVDPEALSSETLEGELISEKFNQIVKPKPSWWKTLLIG
ncbi:MAG TPA: TIGR01620 family protein, partial [Pasteurellaceae bacterium]|nr:TIGR01620 family protein [Pasteurellaceae bacterium]